MSQSRYFYLLRALHSIMVKNGVRRAFEELSPREKRRAKVIVNELRALDVRGVVARPNKKHTGAIVGAAAGGVVAGAAMTGGAGALSGAIAGAAAGSVVPGVGTVIGAGIGIILAATLVGAGVDAATEKKLEKFKRHTADAEEWAIKYGKCKLEHKAKGKHYVPGNPGKGPLYNDCRHERNQMLHHEEEAAKLAKELKLKLESKGQLSPKANEILSTAEQMPQYNARAQYENDSVEYEQEERESRKLGKKKKKGHKPRPEDYPTTVAEAEAEGTSMTPYVLGGVGLLVLVGGGAGLYFYTRKAAFVPSPAPGLPATVAG